MTTLNEFISQLTELQSQGYGDRPVFYRHGASGECGELGSAHLETDVDDMGPFDLEDGKSYISIYAGI